MIDYKTILSTTQDKLTLLQWLKKVEEALKSGSATAVKGVTAADGTFKIEIDFADGTSLVSEPIAAGGLPDGYAVDASGNITLNDALHVAKTGDVEVGKNLEVDGNGYFVGKTVSVSTIPLDESVLPCGIRENPLDGSVCFVGYPGPDYSTGILFDGRKAYFFKQMITADLSGRVLHVDPLAFEANVSKSKYQHTVTIKATATADTAGCYITFTACSSKNTPIDSYQDLNAVFGGCALSASGVARLNAADSGKGTLKLDLHGGTIATDAIVCLDASSAEYSIKLSTLGSPAFSDDVCIPK